MAYVFFILLGALVAASLPLHPHPAPPCRPWPAGAGPTPPTFTGVCRPAASR